MERVDRVNGLRSRVEFTSSPVADARRGSALWFLRDVLVSLPPWSRVASRPPEWRSVDPPAFMQPPHGVAVVLTGYPTKRGVSEDVPGLPCWV